MKPIESLLTEAWRKLPPREREQLLPQVAVLFTAVAFHAIESNPAHTQMSAEESCSRAMSRAAAIVALLTREAP